MSRPFTPGTAYQAQPDLPGVEYIPPAATMSALEQVAFNVVNPQSIFESQETCHDVKKHRLGLKPSGVKMEDVNISGHSIYCEVSLTEPASPPS